MSMTRVMGISLPPLQAVAFTGAGFVAVPIVEGFMSRFLPVDLSTNTLGKYAVRIASVLGLTWLAKSVVGRSAATAVGIGGGAYVLVTAVREFAPGLIPGMSAYTLPSPGMGAYVRKGLGAPAFGATNTAGFAASGGRNVVSARFRRFQ